MSDLEILKISQNAKIYSSELLANPSIARLLLERASAGAKSIDDEVFATCDRLLRALNSAIISAQMSK